MTPRDVALANLQILFRYGGWQERNVEPLTEALVELPDPSRGYDMVEWGQKCCTPYRKGFEHDTSITANPTSAGARHQRDLRVGTAQAVLPHTGTSNPD